MARQQAGHVTDAQRRMAILQDRDKALVERIGLVAVRRVGWNAQRAAILAWRTGNDPAQAASAILRQDLLPVLRDAMVVGHVSGTRRSRLDIRRAPTIAAAITDPLKLRMGNPYRRAVKSMQAVADLSDESLAALEVQYGSQASTVLVGVEREIGRKMATTMAQMTAQGVHVREGRRLLGETFAKLGLTPSNSFTLEAVFRTQTAIAYSAGQWKAEQKPEIQEILWGYKYVTVGDDRVRPEHAGYEGVTLPKNDPFWESSSPPCGWACRCTKIPLFVEEKTFQPRTVNVDGRDVAPKTDPGFAVNFGRMVSTSA